MFICEAVRKDLSDELDDKLPWHRSAFVRLHLKICPPCRAVNRSLRETVELLHELKDEPLEEG